MTRPIICGLDKKKEGQVYLILFFKVIPKRFERLTHALEGRCSIQLSYGTILNCAAKVGTFLETCKQKQKFLLKKDANP